MAKFTDVIRDALISHFNAGDQPTEAQFTALITAIQEGIEEHDHDDTGDGDGIATLAAGLGVGLARTEGTLHVHTASAGAVAANAVADDLVVENSGEGGITILVPDANDANIFFGSPSDAFGAMIRWEFDQLRMIVGTAAAGAVLSLRSGNAVEAMVIDANQDVGIGVTPTYRLDVLDDNSGGYVGRFFNDGDNVNRHGIYVQCGADNGAAVGSTIYFAAKDGNGDWTGQLKTIDGVFQLLDVSDGRLKTNIVDTKLNGLDIINELQVRDYNWKANPDGPAMTSFVAQEAQKVLPAMVSSTEGLLMTSRAMLIPILTKAIQELDARLIKGGM